MTEHRYRVLVRLRSDILDVQGKAIEKSASLVATSGGKDAEASDIRVGRLIELSVPATEDSQEHVERLAKELLANPVMEEFELERVQ